MCAFSPVRSTLVVGSDFQEEGPSKGSPNASMMVWADPSGKNFAPDTKVEDGEPQIACVCRFSPDGTLLVSGSRSSSHAVTIWDTEAWTVAAGWTCNTELDFHAGAIAGICISADKSDMLVASHDTTVSVWKTNFVQTKAASFAIRDQEALASPTMMRMGAPVDLSPKAGGNVEDDVLPSYQGV